MNRLVAFAIAFLTLAAVLRSAESGPVVVVPLDTEVSTAQFYFLRRTLKEAERDGASAFIIEMNTYGGEMKAALNEMDALLKTKLPTFTFINNKAISAGALVAMATKKIYMAPNGVIGAAAPVLMTGDDAPKTMTDKTVSMMSAMARAAAQQNGHNPDLADAFISKTVEVKIGEVIVDKSDSLLTLSAQEATRQFDGKPLLASGIASSIEEVMAQAGLSGTVKRIAPTGFEHLAFWITALAPLLLIGGLIGAYLEFKTPGFGLFGTISIICFAFFFTGHYLAGLAGWEVFVIFAIGVALVISEMVLHPGTILPGVAGLLLMVGALVWAMIDRWPSQPFLPTSEMLARPVFNLAVALLVTGFAVWLLAKFLPHTSLYHRIILSAASATAPDAIFPPSVSAVGLGMKGVAQTSLRPSGKAAFGERLVDVVTQGDFLDAGASVRVVAVEGVRVVVESA